MTAMASPPTSPGSASDLSDLNDDQSSIRNEEEGVEDEPLVWHHDHWDRITDYESPYANWWSDWLSTHWHRNEDSVSNESLHTNPTTQQWLRKFSELTKADFPALQWHFKSVKIPLFTNEDTGEEYQIALHVSEHTLAHTSCPEDPVPWPESQQSKPLVQISRFQAPAPAPAPPGGGNSSVPSRGPLELPRFAIPLGALGVRTNFRRPPHLPANTGPPPTEWTDYRVFLDAESEAMPLWILCSRITLRERHDPHYGRSHQLPIFDGLMELEDQEIGYDAACILDSVHRLGEHPTYQGSCDLVRRTRAVADPMTRNASLAKMRELTGGHVDSE